MKTASAWAPAEVTFVKDGTEPDHLPGFTDHETGLVFLTHPLTGYYYRRDGKVGTYRVWHDRIDVTPATEFGIYLPPAAVGSATASAPRAQSGA